eukprot:TRINITY_DN8434_c0_g1_i1.p1 TRINITY_DN8434_c0_g1~~TRINITY_DN8434_c0_g1_i1.p1  ORF type:complete len:1227 (-),score=207.87 TRINITY_DN8434_c0_g1_i1:66-3644(-)
MAAILWTVLLILIAAGAYGQSASTTTTIFAPQASISTEGFGNLVALSKTVILAGAPNADSDRGAAYVFDCAGSAPTRISAPGSNSGDQFGLGVGITGYGTRLYIGAPSVSSVYTFVKAANNTWSVVERLSTQASGTYFGYAIAGNDECVVIGAPTFAGGGSAYCSCNGSDFSRIQPLDGNSYGSNALYGLSVAIGNQIAIVSAPLATVPGGPLAAGAVFIYKRGTTGTSWSLLQRLDGDTFLSYFGAGVATDDRCLVLTNNPPSGMSLTVYCQNPANANNYVFAMRVTLDPTYILTGLDTNSYCMSAAYGRGAAAQVQVDVWCRNANNNWPLSTSFGTAVNISSSDVVYPGMMMNRAAVSFPVLSNNSAAMRVVTGPCATRCGAIGCSCAAGTYAPNFGFDALQCNSCPSGSYCPGDTAVWTCPSGTYNNMTGASALGDCSTCPAGSYCVSPTSAPVSCPVGFYCVAGATSATPCPAGTYSQLPNREAATQCFGCPERYYCPTAGTVTPLQCSGGSYCKGNTTVPTPCSGGTYLNNTGGLSQADCHNCAAGFYCPSGSSYQRVCPAGSYCVNASASPTACGSGSYSSDTGATSSAVCSSCAAGYYCPEQSSPQQKLCTAGSYCPAGVSVPVPCGPGNYNNVTGSSSSSSCLVCPAGFYCLSSTTSVPAVCPAGNYCPAGSLSPVPCGAGTYISSNGTSSPACLTCLAGSFCASGTAVPTICPTGYYCPAGTAVPIACGIATYNSVTGRSSSDACLMCAAGAFCAASGTSVPTICPSGYYCSAGQSSATPCGIGLFNPNTGSSTATACAACTAGYYCPNAANTQATRCPAGSYCLINSALPMLCGAGTYNQNTGSSSVTACFQCTAGYFCGTSGTVTPTICPTGHYCPPGSATAVPCAAGSYNTFSGSSSASACRGCPAGGFCAQGANSVTACPPGYYCPEASTSLQACAAGTYNPYNGMSNSSACLPCGVGRYCLAGAVAETRCPGDTTSPERSVSQADCQQCSSTNQLGFAPCSQPALTVALVGAGSGIGLLLMICIVGNIIQRYRMRRSRTGPMTDIELTERAQRRASRRASRRRLLSLQSSPASTTSIVPRLNSFTDAEYGQPVFLAMPGKRAQTMLAHPVLLQWSEDVFVAETQPTFVQPTLSPPRTPELPPIVEVSPGSTESATLEEDIVWQEAFFGNPSLPSATCE